MWKHYIIIIIIIIPSWQSNSNLLIHKKKNRLSFLLHLKQRTATTTRRIYHNRPYIIGDALTETLCNSSNKIDPCSRMPKSRSSFLTAGIHSSSIESCWISGNLETSAGGLLWKFSLTVNIALGLSVLSRWASDPSGGSIYSGVLRIAQDCSGLSPWWHWPSTRPGRKKRRRRRTHIVRTNINGLTDCSRLTHQVGFSRHKLLEATGMAVVALIKSIKNIINSTAKRSK